MDQQKAGSYSDYIDCIFMPQCRGTLEEVMNAHPSIPRINPSYMSTTAISTLLFNGGKPTATNSVRALLLLWYGACNRTAGSEAMLLSVAGW